MSVRITDNSNRIKIDNARGISLAIRFALDDIDRRAFPKTPKKQGELRKNIKKSVTGNRGRIKWQSAYAQYQERGRRRDGTHIVRNYTSGGTGKRFAETAVEQVDRNRLSYFRKAKVL